MSKYDLEKPKRYRVKPTHGINREKSNSIILINSHSFLSELKKIKEMLKNGK